MTECFVPFIKMAQIRNRFNITVEEAKDEGIKKTSNKIVFSTY